MSTSHTRSRGKVLLAMSGGVDSSVAAALLQREGYEVVGVFMRLGSPGETIDELQPFDSAGVVCDPAKIKIGHQGCCSINDAADARHVAAELDIPFYVCNFKKDFTRIIDYFADEYEAGRTPNPCVRCNDWLKFGKLHEYAKQVGASYVASGHYVRVVHDDEPFTPAETRELVNGYGMLRGLDDSKDQSYVLFGMPSERLKQILTPIGHMTKAEVRTLARDLDLPVFDKPDSQEICFVPDNDYAGLLERRRPHLGGAHGKIVDTSGAVLGEHNGQHHFTVGQRRGVGVALGYPIYVIDKDPATQTVTVGSKQDLMAQGCIAGEANWIVQLEGDSWHDVHVQVRYNAPARPARVRVLDSQPVTEDTYSGRLGQFEVQFESPELAVAPGQAAVIYQPVGVDDAALIGGGWIQSVQ